MKIVGCDLHTRYQQVAMLDDETGELVERRLEHESGEARAFYAGLGAPGTSRDRGGLAHPSQRLETEAAPPLRSLQGWEFGTLSGPGMLVVAANPGTDRSFPATSLNHTPKRTAGQHTLHSSVRH
jgi:hypothetical protein